MNKRGLVLTSSMTVLTVLLVEGISLAGLKLYEHRNPGIFINTFIESHFNALGEEY